MSLTPGPTVERSGPLNFDYIYFAYRGTGRLSYGKGVRVECDFIAAQMHDGRITVECSIPPGHRLGLHFSDVMSIKGKTRDGHRIELTGDGRLLSADAIKPHPESKEQEPVVLSFQSMRVWCEAGTPATVSYGLTNLRLKSSHVKQANVFIDVQTGPNRRSVLFRPAPIHDDALQWLRIARGVALTSRAVIHIHSLNQLSSLDAFMDNLCYVLSVARGCRVNWITREVLTDDNAVTHRYHGAHVTREYGEMDPLPQWTSDYVQQFIDATYQNYVRLNDKYELDAGTIDLYLEGRSSPDYLETRGAKLVVALEHLCSVYRKSHGRDSTVLAVERFGELRRQAKKAFRQILIEQRVTKNERRQIWEKFDELNRVSFGEQLNDLFQAISFRPHPQEVKMVIAYRNKLVHEGRFYADAASEDDRRRVPALPANIDEYMFLCNFLDRVILCLLGYHGPYSDLRNIRIGYIKNRLVTDDHWPHPLLEETVQG